MTILLKVFWEFVAGEIARRPWLNRATTLDQPDQNCNYSQDEQNVDEPSQRVRTDHAEQPEDQEHYSNRPKHRNFLSSKFCDQLF
jgi:hypothetical protein